MNGKTAVLELVAVKADWVKFQKPDGEVWTMPIKDLVESDRTIAVEMAKQRNYRVSMVMQDDLDSVRSSFSNLKEDNPGLYNRLNELAEYPIEDYEIDVNDEGVYYLQFFLKEGLAADPGIQSQISQHLNSTSLGDEIQFKLNQIPQVGESSDEVMPPLPDESSSAILESPSDMSMDLALDGMSVMSDDSINMAPIMGDAVSMSDSSLVGGCSGCGSMIMPSSPITMDAFATSPVVGEMVATGYSLGNCCNLSCSMATTSCVSTTAWNCTTTCNPCCEPRRQKCRLRQQRTPSLGRLFGGLFCR